MRKFAKNYRESLVGRHILHVAEDFGPGTMPLGGAGQVARSLVLEAINRGARCVVIVERFAKGSPPLEHWTRDGIDVLRLPLLRSVPREARAFGKTRWRQLVAVRQFHKIGRIIRPDLVHFHVYDGALRSAYEFKRRYGVKTVVTAHGLNISVLQSGKYERLNFTPHWAESVESVDTWVPCGPIVYPALVNWGIPERMITPIHNGVYVPHALAPLRRNFGLKQSMRIVYVGRVIEKKGVLDLANAVRKLTKMAPEVRPRLEIAGPCTPEMQSSLTRCLGEGHKRFDFKLFNGVSTVRVQEILRAADIFCHPSKAPGEGLPLAVLEAGAFGCPLILSDHPAHRVVFAPGIHALFHEAGNSTELAFTILQLVNEKGLRQKLRENAYKLVKEKYNIKAMLNGYMRLYEKLLGSG